MRSFRLWKTLVAIAVVPGLLLVGYMIREKWLQSHRPLETVTPASELATPSDKVIVSDQVIKNLGLTAKPLKPQTFWRSIQVPGMVVDRPGCSDRNVVAPATGVVTKVHYFPGDTIRPGNTLFSIRLLSETLQLTQSELFKTAEATKVAREKVKRFASLAAIGTESKNTVFELESQLSRLTVTAQAYRTELLIRGLTPEQIDGAADGKFVSEIVVKAPQKGSPDNKLLAGSLVETPTALHDDTPDPAFEVQELKVELGQQVQAGQTLALLSNHQALYIEGRAFHPETPLVEKAAKEGWPLDVEFMEETGSDWPPLKRSFTIRHIANTINPATRTFAFLLPLSNQSRSFEKDGKTFMLWRFRPGQKVRVYVKVEKVDNVFVLPADSVAREGPEAFVFTQNVNTFERKPCRVLLQDRQHVVVANDGSLLPGDFVAQTAAAQLNRMVKAGSTGAPKGYHIHADGSLHKNEDEGK